MCYGKWGEGDYLKGRPKKGYTCRSKQHLKRASTHLVDSHLRPSKAVFGHGGYRTPRFPAAMGTALRLGIGLVL